MVNLLSEYIITHIIYIVYSKMDIGDHCYNNYNRYNKHTIMTNMIITGYKQMDGVIINNVTGRSSFFISRQLPVSRKLRLLSQELANVRRVTVIEEYETFL